MDDYLELFKKFRKHTIGTQIIDSETLQKACKKSRRSINHKYQSNNWLKMHREPMRRKPFKREFPPIIDEFHERFT